MSLCIQNLNSPGGIVGCAEALEEWFPGFRYVCFERAFFVSVSGAPVVLGGCFLNIGSIWALVSQIWPHQEVSVNSSNCKL